MFGKNTAPDLEVDRLQTGHLQLRETYRSFLGRGPRVA